MNIHEEEKSGKLSVVSDELVQKIMKKSVIISNSQSLNLLNNSNNFSDYFVSSSYRKVRLLQVLCSTSTENTFPES